MFYTYIPHNFGFANMRNFTIKTIDQLKEKIALIKNLADIKITHAVVEEKVKKIDVNVNMYD